MNPSTQQLYGILGADSPGGDTNSFATIDASGAVCISFCLSDLSLFLIHSMPVHL